jgi:hypothetical protein
VSRLAQALVASLLALAAASCGSGAPDGPRFPTLVSLGKGDVFPSITNSTLGPGPNRITMSIIDREDQPVLDAAVHVRYFDLNGERPRFVSEGDATFVPITRGYVDEQSQRQRETTGEDGAYVTDAAFGHPGDWGAEIAITREGRTETVEYRFTVAERSSEPAVGDDAPRSVQQTLATVTDVEEIDSSYPPRGPMHETTIADAVTSGRPAVIAFATPAYCRSRVCAPVMDTVMDPLAAAYGERAAFVHVEPYDLRDLRELNKQTPARATLEWGLASEPWVFVVGRDGRIAAKFEGIMSLAEVEAALADALAADAPP